MTSSKSKTAITVVIPTYKNEKYIGEAISSVIEQKVDSSIGIECVVVDDGSPQNDYGVAREFGSKITLIQQQNKGVCSARNAGAAASTGEYICFLDADDMLAPNALSVRLATLESNSKAVFAHGPAFHVDENGKAKNIEWHWPTGEDAEGILLKKLFQCSFIIQSSTMIRREAFDAVGGWDESYKLHAAEDLLLWLKLSSVGEAAYCKDKTVFYRINPNGASNNYINMLLGEYYSRLHYLKRFENARMNLGSEFCNDFMKKQALICGARLEKEKKFADAEQMYMSSLANFGDIFLHAKPMVRSLLGIIFNN